MKKKKKLNLKNFLNVFVKNAGISEALSTVAKSTLTYTIDLTSSKFDIMVADINKYFPHLPKSAEDLVIRYSRYTCEKWIDEDNAFITMPGSYRDWHVHNGTIIVLTMNVEKTKNHGHDISICLSCANTRHDKLNLRDFIKILVKNHDDYCDRTNKTRVHFVNDTGVFSKKKHDTRTFNDVFISKSEKKELLDSITGFINNREWYKEHSIPYHFGIILHGPAGTGKSSVIKAIAEEYDAFVYYIEPGTLPRTLQEKQAWCDIINGNVKTSIVVIEDVDRYSFLLNREWYTNDEKLLPVYDWQEDDVTTSSGMVTVAKNKNLNDQYYLGVLLNIMDGMNSPENVIWIFTTNHIERLDPALIRPGRIDKKIEIGYVDNETFSEFLLHHFGHGLESGYEVKGGLTFAAIQTDVMLGMTYDDIIKKYCD